MSDIFDINRFYKYFVYDFKQIIGRYGISFFAICMMPFTILIINKVLFIPLNIDSYPGTAQRFSIVVLSYMVLFMTFTSKVYGRLSNRQEGRAWILAPASLFEKYLSMMLISLIIVPVTFFIGYGVSDFLVCMLFPECQEPLFHIHPSDNLPLEFTLRGYPMVFLCMMVPMSVFLAGSLIFKKWKISKSVFLSLAICLFMSYLISWNVFPEIILCNIEKMKEEDVSNLEFHLNLVFYCFTCIPIIIFSTVIWFVLKNLKH